MKEPKRFTLALKEELPKNVITFLFGVISFAIALLVPDLTDYWRTSIRDGSLVFAGTEEISQNIEARITSVSNDSEVIYLIKLDHAYKFPPGQYKCQLFVGQMLVEDQVVDIVPRHTKRITVANIPNEVFTFSVSTDKASYGPGDTVLVTLLSTKKCWVYLFYFNGRFLKPLTDIAIQLDAFSPRMIDRIRAKNSPGDDNFVAVGLTEDRKELLGEALDQLSNRGKSDYLKSGMLWRSEWVTFNVK